MAVTPRTIDEYLAPLDPERRQALEKVRQAIRAAAPDAEECISYGMPAFRRGQVIAGFAACADHGSYYPFSGTALATLGDAVKGYAGTKSALHFPYERSLPAALVRRLVRTRIAEIKGGGRKSGRG